MTIVERDGTESKKSRMYIGLSSLTSEHLYVSKYNYIHSSIDCHPLSCAQMTIHLCGPIGLFGCFVSLHIGYYISSHAAGLCRAVLAMKSIRL